MPITNSSLTGVTLTATSGNPPVPVGTQTILLSDVSVGANSVKITDSDIVAALSSGNTINHSLQLNYANGLSVVSTAGTPYVPPPPPPPPTNEQIISVTRGWGQLILVRFSTLNGRIPVVGSTWFRFYSSMDNFQLLSPYSITADADNTSSRSFFTASMFENFTNPIPNFLVKVVLFTGNIFTGSSEIATLYNVNL